MKLTYSSDGGHASTAAGLIVLQTDETIEPEIGEVLRAAGVSLYVSRIPSAPTVSPETLAQMARDLPQAAALLPLPARLQVIGYGCTSGANEIGSARVAELVRQSQPQAVVIDPLSAVCAAFDALGAKRIGFLSPYAAEVSAAMRETLSARGYEVVAFTTFDEDQEEAVARIDGTSVTKGLRCLADQFKAEQETGAIDALFASCTNLRTFSVIADTERALCLPIISSNQALAWALLRALSLPTRGAGPGQLFDTYDSTTS